MLKTLILTALGCSMLSFTAFAGQGRPRPAPVRLEFDCEAVQRLCYAGHPGSTVLYKEGVAVMDDSCFRITDTADYDAAGDIGEVYVDISLIYENESNTGSFRETVRKFAPGDIKLNEYYPIFTESTARSLAERGKFYSDSLKGLEISFGTGQQGGNGYNGKLYLYICSMDSFYDMYDRAANEQE